jgi:hypothetical protein
MKYIRLASDIHIDGFLSQTPQTLRETFLPDDPRDAESILVLAGDISSNSEQLVGFLGECAKKFPKVYFVAGNHEFYKHDYIAYPPVIEKALTDMMGEQQSNNLKFAFDCVGYEELDDIKVRFIFAPMWGDGGPTLDDQAKTGFYLNDFRLITMRRGSTMGRFTVQEMMAEHRKQKAEIDRLLKLPFDGKTVVITHHLPSRRLVSARFWPSDGSDGANGGFVGQCDDILAYDHAPNLWINGHTHDRISTTLWKTRVECNPAGYRGEWMTKFNTFMQPNAQGSREVVPVFIDLDAL